MDAEQIKLQNEKLRAHMMSLARPEGWAYTEELLAQSLSRCAENGPELAGIEQVVLIGHGTSLATAINAEFLFARVAGVNARAIAAYQLATYPREYLRQPKKTLVVGISCSGNTKSVVRGLEEAKKLGAQTMCISGGGEIKLAPLADFRIVVHTEAEHEAGVSAYSVSHLFILLGALRVALLLGQKNGRLSATKAARLERHWADVKAKLACLPELFETMRDVAEQYVATGLHNLVVLGTGPNLGTMQEGALKICEFSWLFCAGEELEDFAHGRFREVDGSIPLFILTPGAATRDKTLDLLAGCKIAGTPAVLFTEQSTPALEELAARIITLPQLEEECFTPFLYVFPLWFFGFSLRARAGELVGEKRFGLLATDIDYQAYLGRRGK